MGPVVMVRKTNLRSSLMTLLGQHFEIFSIAQNCFRILGQMWLLTTGPLIGFTVFFAESLPSDRTVCRKTCSVITQHGEMTFYQRCSTARFALRIVLRSAWNDQRKQQQQQDVLSQRSRGKLQAGHSPRPQT